MSLQRLSHAGAAPPSGLVSPINASVLTFGIISGVGFPTGANGPFVLVLDPGQPAEEKVLCSSLTGTTVTVMAGGRGWDGTTAAAHGAAPGNVAHVFSAAEADDANAHIYVPSRDDHTQYVLAQGSRNSLVRVYNNATQAIATGGVTVQYNTVINDPYSAFNTSTYAFACPYAGPYRIRAQVQWLQTTVTLALNVYKNGSVMTCGLMGSGTLLNPLVGNPQAAVDDSFYCNSGDTLTVQAWASAATTIQSNSAVSLATFQLLH